MIGAKRGRPRKHISSGVGWAEALSAPEEESLSAKLKLISGVAKLPNDAFAGLLSDLRYAVAHYRAGSEMNRTRKSPPGNKHKAHVEILISDCQLAWGKAAGEKNPAIWESRDYDLNRLESIVLSIARACIETVTGSPYTASLGWQARQVSDIERDSGEL